MHDLLQSTYIIPEKNHKQEIQRLITQDTLLNQSFGGTLPEQDNPFRFLSLLDLGCGPGTWLMELAKEYPHFTSLTGIDINPMVIDYAKREGPTLDFQEVDILKGLPYQMNSFDMVNMRLGSSFMRTWDWLRILGEMHRVTHPGGVVRIVELQFPESTSPAHSILMEYVIEAVYRAGHIFSPSKEGVIDAIFPMFKNYDMHNIQKKDYTFTFTSKDTKHAENTTHFFSLIQPFLQKWIRLPGTYTDTYTKMLEEMKQPNCETVCRFSIMWGEK